MRVLLLLGDRSGCGFYRMTEPARVVTEAFPDFHVETDVRIQARVSRDESGAVVEVSEVDARGADVVVFQRPSDPATLLHLRRLQEQGVAVVVEADDLLSAVPRAHVGYRYFVRAAEVLHRCAAEADLVTASTPALLAAYARHGRGEVVPNAIPRRIAELPPAYERDSTPVAVGWTGQVGSHPHDLPEMGSGLRQAFDTLGDESVFRAWNPLGIAEQTGVQPEGVGMRPDVESFLDSVGQLDVGIAPLREDRFNAAKSWLKPLEYAARGVLPVYSDFGEYRRLGLGVPARRPRDWAARIVRAVRDGDWRREQAQAAHRRVLHGHLTEHTADRWAAAWKQAADMRTKA